MRTQQLQNALHFIKSAEQEKEQLAEERSVALAEMSAKQTHTNNQNQLLEGELNTLKVENGYLKELILTANENYEKLEQQNQDLLTANELLQE